MHEITKTDNVVLAGEPAWHGLGTVVESAPTPSEALGLAGLDWQVETWPMMAFGPEGDRVEAEGHYATVRTDTGSVLGAVGRNYEPIQNRELAEFAEALAEQGDVVRCETAGSIRGGKRVWFLLRGASFSVRGDGETVPYILVANGHDGTCAMRCIPTSVRVVCSNTLHLVLPGKSGSLGRDAGFVVRHSGDVAGKVEAAKRALQLYGRSLESSREVMASLASRSVTRKQVQDFWLDVYQRVQSPVPADPRTAGEKMQRTLAERAMGKMAERFDAERGDGCDASGWLAFNAVSGWLQHDRPVQAKGEGAREQRVLNQLFGTAAKDTRSVLAAAVGAFG